MSPSRISCGVCDWYPKAALKVTSKNWRQKASWQNYRSTAGLRFVVQPLFIRFVCSHLAKPTMYRTYLRWRLFVKLERGGAISCLKLQCQDSVQAYEPGLCPGLRAATVQRLALRMAIIPGNLPRECRLQNEWAEGCVDIYIYMYVSIYVHIYIYIYMYLETYHTSTYIYIYVYMYICICICIHVDMCMLIYLCGCLDQWTGVSVLNQPVSYLLLDAMAEAWGHCCCEGACEIQSGRLKIHILVAEFVEGKIHRKLPDLIL